MSYYHASTRRPRKKHVCKPCKRKRTRTAKFRPLHCRGRKCHAVLNPNYREYRSFTSPVRVFPEFTTYNAFIQPLKTAVSSTPAGPERIGVRFGDTAEEMCKRLMVKYYIFPGLADSSIEPVYRMVAEGDLDEAAFLFVNEGCHKVLKPEDIRDAKKTACAALERKRGQMSKRDYRTLRNELLRCGGNPRIVEEWPHTFAQLDADFSKVKELASKRGTREGLSRRELDDISAGLKERVRQGMAQDVDDQGRLHEKSLAEVEAQQRRYESAKQVAREEKSKTGATKESRSAARKNERIQKENLAIAKKAATARSQALSAARRDYQRKVQRVMGHSRGIGGAGWGGGSGGTRTYHASTRTYHAPEYDEEKPESFDPFAARAEEERRMRAFNEEAELQRLTDLPAGKRAPGYFRTAMSTGYGDIRQGLRQFVGRGGRAAMQDQEKGFGAGRRVKRGLGRMMRGVRSLRGLTRWGKIEDFNDKCQLYTERYGIIPHIPPTGSLGAPFEHGIDEYIPEGVPDEMRELYKQDCAEFITATGDNFAEIRDMVGRACVKILQKDKRPDDTTLEWVSKYCFGPTFVSDRGRQKVCQKRGKQRIGKRPDAWQTLTYTALSCPKVLLTDPKTECADVQRELLRLKPGSSSASCTQSAMASSPTFLRPEAWEHRSSTESTNTFRKAFPTK